LTSFDRYLFTLFFLENETSFLAHHAVFKATNVQEAL
jgi:hypothetical protein